MTTNDTTTPEEVSELMKPEEWRDRLLTQLFRQQPLNRERISWYLGTQPPPDVPAKYKGVYKLLLDMSRDAWGRLLVDAISERVNLTGVRLSGDEADLDLWRILKGNHIDVDQRLVHSEALTLATSYYSVWTDGDDGVKIVPESGFQVTHEADPADRREMLAAIKAWKDDVRGLLYATIYLPESIFRWSAPIPDSWTDFENTHTHGSKREKLDHGDEHSIILNSSVSSIQEKVEEIKWVERDEFEVENTLGRVPIVPISNRPTLFAGAQSEIDDLVPILERIDKFTLDLLVTSEAGSFKQKWATGLKVPTDPISKKPIEPYDAAVSKLWIATDEKTKFGSFDASELAPYLAAIDAQVAQLSAVSRVPSYYLVSPNLVNPPSAETMQAVEGGLIRKAEALMGVWGEAYEELIRLALEVLGDERADEEGLELVWDDPSMPSAAVQADAAVKWATLGVPNEVLWEKGGATPEEIARWKTISARQALTAAVLAPPVTVAESEEIGEETEQAEATEVVEG